MNVVKEIAMGLAWILYLIIVNTVIILALAPFPSYVLYTVGIGLSFVALWAWDEYIANKLD